MARVFTDNDITFSERTKRTKCDVFEISDRGGDEREHKKIEIE
jgi:hypothetical protein